MKNKTKIPEGWRETNLGEVIKIRKGLTYKSLDYGDETEGLIFINLKCIAKGGGFNNAGVKYYKGKYSEEDLVNGGDLIIANTDLTRAGDVIGAPLFVPNITNKKMLMSMDVSALDIDKNLTNKKFIYYYLLQDRVRQYMRNISSGSTVLHLKVQEIPKFKILLPPFATQNKIAEILGAVDEEIDGVNSVVVKSEKLRNGLMGEIFSEKLKVKSEKLGKIAKVERGRFSVRPRNDPRFYGGDIPFIQTGDVVGCNGRINTYRQTLNDEGLKVSKMFKKGTIVLTIAANIGDTGILDFDSCFPDSLVGITVSDRVNNIFLEYYLRTKKEYLNSIATQSAQKNINLQKLEPMAIFLPPLDEQIKIASVLSAIDNKILIYKKIKNNLTQLKKGLMADLLSGEKNIKYERNRRKHNSD